MFFLSYTDSYTQWLNNKKGNLINISKKLWKPLFRIFVGFCSNSSQIKTFGSALASQILHHWLQRISFDF